MDVNDCQWTKDENSSPVEKTDPDSIENVYNFINRNPELSLMELPGLKMKQRMPVVPLPLHEQIPSALRINIFPHNEKILKTTLKSKEMTVAQFSSLVFNKLKLSEADSSHFVDDLKMSSPSSSSS